MLLTDKDLLLVIDMQRDFLPDGALAVAGAHELIPVIRRIGRRFADVVLTQDWHPPAHISFASRHGKRPYLDTAEVRYGRQALWPDHTVQNSAGAEIHPELLLGLPHAGLVLRKGFRPEVDSYSAFLENDHATPTGLAGYLRDRGKERIFLCGVAKDYCVGFSALDGRMLGFEVVVIADATLAVAEDTGREMEQQWELAGVQRILSGDLL